LALTLELGKGARTHSHRERCGRVRVACQRSGVDPARYVEEPVHVFSLRGHGWPATRSQGLTVVRALRSNQTSEKPGSSCSSTGLAPGSGLPALSTPRIRAVT